MQRILAWLLAGLLLAAAVWVVRSTQHESVGSSQGAGQPPPSQARNATPEASVAVSAERADLRRAPEVASAPLAAEDSAAPVPQPGTDPQRDPREALRSLLEATRGASGRAAPAAGADAADGADGPAARGDAADAADAGVDPELAELEKAAADRAEALELIPPQELEPRIQREMRRCRCDYDAAKTKVLADQFIADALAGQKRDPDGSPLSAPDRRERARIGETFLPLLPPDRRKDVLNSALGRS